MDDFQREIHWKQRFHPLHSPMFLMSFVVVLLCSAPGAVVYFFYKPSGEAGHLRMREMEKEMAALEHEISTE